MRAPFRYALKRDARFARVAGKENSIFQNRSPIAANLPFSSSLSLVASRDEVCAWNSALCTLYLKRCFVTAGLWVVPMRTGERKRAAEEEYPQRQE